MLKAEAINQAYAEIRISGLTSDQVPEETEVALRELDQLMYRWQAIGRDVNYNFPPPTTGQELRVSNPSDLFGVFDWAISGTVAQLAKFLVEYYGKDVPPALAGKARAGLNTIMAMTVKLRDVQYPNRMPRGSGNTRFGFEFQRYYHPVYFGREQPEPVLEQQIIDLYFDFSNDLPNSETIASYTLDVYPAGAGVTLVSQAQDGNVINYRIQGNDSSRAAVIFCNVTTSAGNTLPRTQTFATIQTELV